MLTLRGFPNVTRAEAMASPAARNYRTVSHTVHYKIMVRGSDNSKRSINISELYFEKKILQ